MNNVNLIGRISNDLEIKSSDDIQFVKFGLAVNTFKKDSDGNYITNFFNITAWNKNAVNLCKMSNKGKRVAVNGYLDISKYTDSNGNKRNDYFIVANSIDIIDFNEKNIDIDQEDF